MVHLLEQIGEILLVIDLRVLQESLIQCPDENQYLTPVNVHGVAHLHLAHLPALALRLMRDIEVLLVKVLHDVRLEEACQNLTLAKMDSTSAC